MVGAHEPQLIKNPQELQRLVSSCVIRDIGQKIIVKEITFHFILMSCISVPCLGLYKRFNTYYVHSNVLLVSSYSWYTGTSLADYKKNMNGRSLRY